VKARAAELGFDACGVADAENVDPDGHLRDWVARGYHADMDWMVRTAAIRADVRRKMPHARSVVVVARNYYSGTPHRPPVPESRVAISRYAWGRDYHRVLLKPLRALAKTIATLGPAGHNPPYVCIDSGPVLERAYAARAGIGWIGKNGLVLREDLGSWFFLGIVVTETELAPDTPVRDRCGQCTRCIEACPTGAIVEPGVVDSRRCISYHTVENRGEIPADIREKMGGWIFGCDMCQDVCPWNRFARQTTEPGFFVRPEWASLCAEEWLDMDEATFDRLTCGSPLRRAKYAGIKRNLAVAASASRPSTRR